MNVNGLQNVPGEIISLITAQLPIKDQIALKNSCQYTQEPALKVIQETIAQEKQELLDAYDHTVNSRAIYYLETYRLEAEIGKIFRIAGILQILSDQDNARYTSLIQQNSAKMQSLQSMISKMPFQC